MQRLVLLVAVYAWSWCGCAPALGPTEEADIARHGGTLARCQVEGRAIGKDGGLARYEACKADAGIQ